MDYLCHLQNFLLNVSEQGCLQGTKTTDYDLKGKCPLQTMCLNTLLPVGGAVLRGSEMSEVGLTAGLGSLELALKYVIDPLLLLAEALCFLVC